MNDRAAWILLAVGAVVGQTPTNKAGSLPVKSDTWQKSKECAAQAEKAMSQWYRPPGPVPDDWKNHYSQKYDKCFVEVAFLTGTQTGGGLLPRTYLVDAFERRSNLAYFREKPICAGACSQEIEDMIKNAPCSIDALPVDCAKAENFISEHMKN